MHEKYSRPWFLSSVVSISSLFWSSTATAQVKVRRVRNQYIASLGAPDATSGTGAETWGIWEEDPGPKGVWLRFYKLLRKAGNSAPSGWRIDIDEPGMLARPPSDHVAFFIGLQINAKPHPVAYIGTVDAMHQPNRRLQ